MSHILEDLVVAVSLNSAITQVISVPSFTIGQTARVQERVAIASSKTINAARLLTNLGRQAMVVGIVGEADGSPFTDKFQKEGIPCDLVLVEEDARRTFEIHDQTHGTTTLILDQGPEIPTGAMESFLEKVAEHLEAARLLILAGSLPRTTTLDTYRMIADKAAKHSKLETIIDCHGEVLRHTIMARPLLVRINQEEAEGFLGRRLHGWCDAVRAAREICEAGAQWTCISLGQDGAVLASPNSGYHSSHPPVDTVSPIGSGDAMLAGFAMAIMDNLSPPEMLKIATACGVANAGGLVPCAVTPEDLHQALPMISVNAVPV